MEIEQLPPNRPNFGLIVALSCAAILLIFAVALAFLHFEGKHITMGTQKNTELRVPLALPGAGSPLYRSTPV